MLLTKDNLLRYVREKKYVTPTTIAEAFETTTMIASAALSELAKDKQVAITYLKLSSSPYYYDPKQKQALVELGEKHFSSYDKEVFFQLREKEIINDNVLTIQLRLAVERIKDFAVPLEIEHNGILYKFWLWYMRDINETRKQIMDVLNPKQAQTKQTLKSEVKKTTDTAVSRTQASESQTPAQKQEMAFRKTETDEHEDQKEAKIEEYLNKNYLKIESKNKTDKGIAYQCSLRLTNMTLALDCFYFYKKPLEPDVMRFYTGSQKPKILFITAAPKKLFKLAETLDNLTIVDL